MRYLEFVFLQLNSFSEYFFVGNILLYGYRMSYNKLKVSTINLKISSNEKFFTTSLSTSYSIIIQFKYIFQFKDYKIWIV